MDTRVQPKQHEGVLTREVGDTLLLLNTRSGKYFSLDEVGACIWSLCDGERRVAEIASAISEEYEQPLDAVTSDVVELLSDLEGEQLISVSDARP